jgi:hypothetical protein
MLRQINDKTRKPGVIHWKVRKNLAEKPNNIPKKEVIAERACPPPSAGREMYIQVARAATDAAFLLFT